MSLFVENLSFSYVRKSIFKSVNFTAHSGKIVALIGSSGIGKTTFFKLISGILSPNNGRIFLKNKQGLELSLKDNFSYMQQKDLLLPWRTVYQNLLLNFELKTISLDRESYEKKIEDLLKKMCLWDYRDSFPKELSGGMCQRISLLRTISQDKLLILLDEPFSSLDMIIKESLYLEIKQFVLKTNKILLLITHDFRDALFLADDIFIIKNFSIIKSNIKGPIYSLTGDQKVLLEEEIREYLK